MPITTNESHSSSSPDLSNGDENGRTGGAAGVEVPVIVHASRYSSSANTVGKTLPPVHEETRTVIVFEQGAVVRLSAAVTTGEVVVLTNKLTGADVICKVANVKAQPGIQNYVSLEFTQRAPGFWGESRQNTRAPQVEATPAVVASPTLTPRAAEPAPPPAKTAPVAAIPAEAVSVQPPVAPVTSYEHQAVAPGIAEPISAPPAARGLPAPPAKVFEAEATLGLRQSSAVPANPRPTELAISSQGPARGGKNIALIAVAAIVLLLVGGVGTWLWLRPSQPAAPLNQAASASQTPVVTSQVASQSENPAAPDATLPALAQAEPQPVSTGTALRSDVRTDPRSEAPAIQPAAAKSVSEPSASASTSVPPASPKSAAAPTAETNQRPVLAVGKMAAPTAGRMASSSTSSEAPPELLAQSGTLAGGSLNDSLFTTSARNSGPASPSPSKSQLVQPKLISSPAALYPSEARTAHIQGDVAIDVFIDEGGRVAAAKVISGPVALQHAAVTAVSSWKYQPAQLDGRPISIHMRVDVNFRLQ